MPATRYSYTAITLHWLIALLLAFQIALGWALEGNNSPELFARYQLHKSIGITILLLSLARLAIRPADRVLDVDEQRRQLDERAAARHHQVGRRRTE